MKPLQIMIDIETLGVTPGSAILEIAAATFTFEDAEGWEWFNVEIDLLSSLAAGLTADAGTAAFHLKNGFAGHLRGQALGRAMIALTAWMNERAATLDRVWAWGMDFERKMIEGACRALKMDFPWKYSRSADARTVWNIAFPGKPHAPRKHRAKDDVIDQIIDLRTAVSQLKGKVP
jgi:hypothetical protein